MRLVSQPESPAFARSRYAATNHEPAYACSSVEKTVKVVACALQAGLFALLLGCGRGKAQCPFHTLQQRDISASAFYARSTSGTATIES